MSRVITEGGYWQQSYNTVKLWFNNICWQILKNCVFSCLHYSRKKVPPAARPRSTAHANVKGTAAFVTSVSSSPRVSAQQATYAPRISAGNELLELYATNPTGFSLCAQNPATLWPMNPNGQQVVVGMTDMPGNSYGLLQVQGDYFDKRINPRYFGYLPFWAMNTSSSLNVCS